MVIKQFDRALQSLATSPGRRSMLGGMLGALVGGALGNVSPVRAKRKMRKPVRKCSRMYDVHRCGDKCVNTVNDRNHCGACGHQCPNDQECVSKECVTPE